jgi:bifunctional UDP-N-acetylglucosamine pyrophosphorylase/glucosamine-1-phosphate N-acetyltransferase
MEQLTALVLAAGDSKRMRSSRSKVLHELCGRPIIEYPLRACRSLGARIVMVVAPGTDALRAVAAAVDPQAMFVEQAERLGTGHAVGQARQAVAGAQGPILVLPGDMPLLADTTLRAVVDRHLETRAAATMLTVVVEDPTGYGRVIRDGGRPVAIVEHRDATSAQREIREIATSVYCFDPDRLWPALDGVRPGNVQGEYYLTDVIAILVETGHRVEAVVAADAAEGLGVNDRRDLARAGAALRERILDRLMVEGVTVIDPATTYVDDAVRVGPDSVLHPGVILEGPTAIGSRCAIGAGCHVTASRLGDAVVLKPYSVVVDSVIEDGAQLGPFCHLRPASHVGPAAKIGNFVELKKSRIGRGGKVPHLSYVGDAVVGEGANIGAGTITCNYDGVAKHETRIGDGAFVGTNASLVAPITIGEGAYVAAGSVITKNVPPGALAVARGRQEMREGWAARKRKGRPAPAAAPAADAAEHNG